MQEADRVTINIPRRKIEVAIVVLLLQSPREHDPTLIRNEDNLLL